MKIWSNRPCLSVALLALFSLPLAAEITKGTLVLSDDSFIDRIISVSGNVIVSQETRDLYQEALGSELGFFNAIRSGGSMVTGFTNNYCLNGDGPDLVIFEAGTPEPILVEINGVEKLLLPSG